MYSQSQDEKGFGDLYSPLDSDSPLYPKRTDEVINLLKLIRDKGGEGSGKDNVNQSKFYRQLFSNHFEELSEPCGVSQGINAIKMVDAVPPEERKLKAQKLDYAEQQECSSIKKELEDSEGDNNSLTIPGSQFIKNPTNFQEECSLQNNIVQIAQHEDILRQSGQELFSNFCEIEDEKQKLSICHFILQNITNEGFRNIMSFLTDQFLWENQDLLNMFVEKVIFKRLLTQNFADDSQEILQFILGLLAKDEELVTRGFLLPLMKQSDSSESHTLSLITLVLRHIHENSNKKAVFVSYLCNRSKLIDEVELTFLEVLIVEHDFDGFKDHTVLKDFAQYLLVSSVRDNSNSMNLNKSTRFGKFLLNVIKKMPTEIPSIAYEKLCQVVDVHISFLKKAMSIELKKHVPK